MENIIQQIALDLVEKITKKAFEAKISDIDTLASDVLADCKTAACEILEAAVAQLNESIRKEKATRKELGLILKEKNRKRSILTELGTLNLPRDYFFDKTCDRYVFVLDAMLGLQRYERISGNVRTRLVTEATDVSYAKSAQIVTGGSVSRQSVGNAIRKLTVLEKEPDWIEKKKVKELHVYADEDHVHLQKPKKEAGKKGKIVPLVSVTEGTESNGRRQKTICPMHFVDEHFDSKALWNTVEGYIQKAYAVDSIEKIYVHADGGGWIRSGLKDFAQTEHVLDGFHLEKYLRRISARFPKKNLRIRFCKAFEENDRIAHAVKQRVELPPLRRFFRCLIREKELVYGYVITGNKLIKDLQAWLLPFVFNIRKVARGNVHFVAYFLAAFIPACSRCFYGLPESCKVI